MKAMPYLLAMSLAANLVLGWMLWQRHPAPAPEPDPAVAQYELWKEEAEPLPLPATPMPLTVSPLLPLAGATAHEADRLAPPDTPPSLMPTVEDKDKPYGPPPPPNRHAFPPWRERTPYRETQYHRALLSDPR
jgi:hypothetical protein